MDWFAQTVKRNLEKRGFQVTKSDNYTFDFIATNRKGKKVAVKCQAHGHVYTPQKKELHSLSHRLGLDSVYVASEKYVTDPWVHEVKLTKLVQNKKRSTGGKTKDE